MARAAGEPHRGRAIADAGADLPAGPLQQLRRQGHHRGRRGRADGPHVRAGVRRRLRARPAAHKRRAERRAAARGGVHDQHAEGGAVLARHGPSQLGHGKDLRRHGLPLCRLRVHRRAGARPARRVQQCGGGLLHRRRHGCAQRAAGHVPRVRGLRGVLGADRHLLGALGRSGRRASRGRTRGELLPAKRLADSLLGLARRGSALLCPALLCAALLYQLASISYQKLSSKPSAASVGGGGPPLAFPKARLGQYMEYRTS
mmetsp:Transcript_4763/g.17119  ORF Transcript_4763/g.17119 Transcript_4763/m.17119 type:complete len:259 (+) Transcript_4763:317-1093(+)